MRGRMRRCVGHRGRARDLARPLLGPAAVAAAPVARRSTSRSCRSTSCTAATRSRSAATTATGARTRPVAPRRSTAVAGGDPGERRRHRRDAGGHRQRLPHRRPRSAGTATAGSRSCRASRCSTRRAATASTSSPRSPRPGRSPSPTSTCRPTRTGRTSRARAGRSTRSWPSSTSCGCRPSSRSSPHLPPLAAAGIPVVLTGDFNSPSHLDWTAAVSAVRPVEAPYPIDWPVAHALADAGFTDSYREVHPDPVADPGFTWTPGYPRERKGVEVHDRIDWVLHAGPSRPWPARSSAKSAYAGTGIAVDPWPSDHRGVVSTLRVTPAVPASRSRPSTAGGCSSAIRRPCGSIGTGAAGRADGHRPGRRPAPAPRSRPAPTGGAVSAAATFATGDLGTGCVRRGLVVATAPSSVVAVAFHVYPAGAKPTVTTDKASYREGEPIRGVVDVPRPAGSGTGWPSRRRAPATSSSRRIAPAATAARPATSCTRTRARSSRARPSFDATAQVGKTTWPLEHGWYRIALYFDDGYAQLASPRRSRSIKAPTR